MAKLSDNIITVFIPTYNGEKYIGECIESILSQKIPKKYSLDILVIDSGSTDETISILNKYKEHIRLVQIDNSEFGHGKTRQYAAEISKGEYILFLTQDATPCDENWIINIVEPFLISNKISCVFGRQIPRRNAPPNIKREINTAFGVIGPPDSIIIQRFTSIIDGHKTNDINTFFSDVNSAVRRSILIKKVPFRDVDYAEDQALSVDMQNNGFLKAYTPLAAVWHSNEYTPREFYRRKFDEYIGLQKVTDLKIYPQITSLLFGWIGPTIRDYKYMSVDPDNNIVKKIKWLLIVPQYNFAVQKGKFLAAKLYDQDKSIIKKHSQELFQKNKNH